MTNQNIDALNDVTKTLIDSCKGYEKACEVSDDSYALRAEFQRRANERKGFIIEFQNKVRELGGEPATSGGTAGAVHRVLTDFSTLFRDDEKAAISAIDDGEEYLADEIESKLEREELTAEVRSMLQKAHTSAKQGECFADRLEETG